MKSKYRGRVIVKSYKNGMFLLIDYVNDEEFEILLDFMTEISCDKLIYVHSDGLDGINQANILRMVLPVKKKGYKLQIKTINQATISEEVFENRWVRFDIYSSKEVMAWEEYINSKDSFIKKTKGIEKRYASIILAEDGCVEIHCSTRNRATLNLIKLFSERGYRIGKYF